MLTVRISKMFVTELLQYIHLIPAPVDRTSTSAWLNKRIWVTSKKVSQVLK